MYFRFTSACGLVGLFFMARKLAQSDEEAASDELTGLPPALEDDNAAAAEAVSEASVHPDKADEFRTLLAAELSVDSTQR